MIVQHRQDKDVSIYIILRQSPDWISMDMEAFREQSRTFCRSINRPENFIVDCVELWDRTFGVAFLETRQRLKEIALENLSRVEGAELIGSVGKVRFRRRPRAIYFFVDDDDWIDPDILSSLKDVEPGYSGIIWGSIVFGSGEEFIKFREITDFCFTNNYAVTSNYFRNPLNRAESVYQHFRANGKLKRIRTAILPKYLAATNKHPGSTTALESTFKDGMTRRVLVESVTRYNERLRAADKARLGRIGWAGAPLEKTRVLFEEVEKSVS